jgi:hypothetical protein
MWKATRRHRQNVDCSGDFERAPCRLPGSHAMSGLNADVATKFGAFCPPGRRGARVQRANYPVRISAEIAPKCLLAAVGARCPARLTTRSRNLEGVL